LLNDYFTDFKLAEYTHRFTIAGFMGLPANEMQKGFLGETNNLAQKDSVTNGTQINYQYTIIQLICPIH